LLSRDRTEGIKRVLKRRRGLTSGRADHRSDVGALERAVGKGAGGIYVTRNFTVRADLVRVPPLPADL
jgi:hypothetical protein